MQRFLELSTYSKNVCRERLVRIESKRHENVYVMTGVRQNFCILVRKFPSRNTNRYFSTLYRFGRSHDFSGPGMLSSKKLWQLRDLAPFESVCWACFLRGQGTRPFSTNTLWRCRPVDDYELRRKTTSAEIKCTRSPYSHPHARALSTKQNKNIVVGHVHAWNRNVTQAELSSGISKAGRKYRSFTTVRTPRPLTIRGQTSATLPRSNQRTSFGPAGVEKHLARNDGYQSHFGSQLQNRKPYTSYTVRQQPEQMWY